MTNHRLPVVVLEQLAAPERLAPGEPFNPYTSLTVGSLDPARVKVVYFDWRTAILKRYDVVHLHWPEQLLRRRNRWQSARGVPLLVLLLLKWWALRVPIVRTLHNEVPHEAGTRLMAAYLRLVDRLTTEVIILNPTTLALPQKRRTLIPHGHYRSWYTASSEKQVAGRILTFGLIRPYKGVDRLIQCFSEIADTSISLRIVGHPSTAFIASDLRQLAARDARVSLHLEFVNDNELAAEIAQAEVVVLPYTQLHNSGAALLALSLDRPLILPETAGASSLVEEFGGEWVTTYEQPLRPESLSAAIATAREQERGVRPDMTGREWNGLGGLLADVLVRAVDGAVVPDQRLNT